MQQELQKWLSARRQRHEHRCLLVITGPKDWCLAQLEPLDFTDPLFVNLQHHTAPTTSNKLYRQELGREYASLIYNAHDGFRASAFAALASVVARSGLLVLLCPSITEWPTFAEPESSQRSGIGFVADITDSPFIKLLTQQLKEQTESIAWLQSDGLTLPKLAPAKPGPDHFELTQDQQRALAQIYLSAKTPTPQPLVLRADRGRGKSTILGMAAARLCKDNRVLVTAPSKRQLNSFYHYAGESDNIEFRAVDELIESAPFADILLVDEAAMFPVDTIKKLINHYPRIIMATTVHGYEGSGQGFDIRVPEYLNQHYPSWSLEHLQQPTRWAADCPLEALTWRIMCQSNSSEPLATADGIYALNGREAAERPGLLMQAWQLMVSAHYQTTPDDLQRLLDGPDNTLVVKIKHCKVIAVMWISSEPDHLSAYSDKICRGERRLAGYLTPQLLAYTYSTPEVLALRGIRVVRIASAAGNRKQGHAKSLIDWLHDYAKRHNCDYLSSSFGATPGLLSFWQHCGFFSIHLGEKRDASSAEYSALCISPKNATAGQYFQRATQAFCQRLPFTALGKELELLSHLLKMLMPVMPFPEKLLFGLFGSRPITSQPELLLAALFALAPHARNAQELELLIAACLLRMPEKMIISDFKLAGKKQLHQQLKSLVKELYQTGRP